VSNLAEHTATTKIQGVKTHREHDKLISLLHFQSWIHVSHYHFPISWPIFTKTDTTVMSMDATRISWFLIHSSQNTSDTRNETSTNQAALGFK